MKKYPSFFGLISTLKGDYIYYTSLYLSCYNTEFRIKEDESGKNLNEERKKHRRVALNIKNIVDNITNFEGTIVNKFTLSTSQISFWIAILALIISIAASSYTSKVSGQNTLTIDKESISIIESSIKSIDKE